MDEIDSILEGNIPQPQPEAQPETIGQPRDEHGRFAPTTTETGVEQGVEPEQAPPASEQQSNGLPQAEYAALKDERRRRQEAERRIADLEARIPKAPPPEPVDFWDNPDAALEQRFEQLVPKIMTQIQVQQWEQRTAAQEAAARAKYADFDEAIETFHQLADSNPAIVNELRAAPDAAEFAYRKATEARLLQQHGGVEGLLKAERAKWEAEFKTSPSQIPTAPTTTATTRSVGSRGGPAWAGPPSIEDLLAR